MIEIRFDGELDNLTVVIVDHEEKTFVVTGLETANEMVDFEAEGVNPYLENAEDLWLGDQLPQFVEHLEDEGYKEMEAE